MITLVLSFLLLYKYLALFLVVFLVAIIVPLPINILLLAVGAFSSFGYFNIGISISVVTLASIFGDLVDFFLARYYGPKIFNKLKIKKHYYFERLEKGLRENAPFTIFITRFVGTFEQLISFFSGSVGIPLRTFILYDFLGNLISAILVIGVGYFAGSYWQNFSGLINIASWILVIILMIFIIIRIFLTRQAKNKKSTAPKTKK